jgi:hypothetical protein
LLVEGLAVGMAGKVVIGQTIGHRELATGIS